MIESIYIFLAILPAILATLTTAIGQGLIGKQALASMHKQPSANSQITKLAIIATAMTETAAIFGLVISILLLNDLDSLVQNEWALYPLLGIACAIGLSGMCAGIVAAFPAIASCQSLARQPFMQGKILNLMLVTQTLIMTPNMFGLIIALLIKGKMLEVHSFSQAMQLFCSGLSIGLGCIGPSIGLAFFTYQACYAIGINPTGYNKIITFTFVGQAIIETPIIFSLLISLMILTTHIQPDNLLQPWQFLAAALCMGLSTFAPGISLGRTGSIACNQIALRMHEYGNISKLAMLGLAMIDTFTIYGLVIAVVLLFV